MRRLCSKADPNFEYLRGPVLLGGGLVGAVNQGYNFIMTRKNAGINEPVLLTGYSRGAAGAVAIASKLKKQNVAVEAMLLFDCVDRHLFVDAEVVPNNVKYYQHLMRDPLSASRESFSNDGMLYQPPTIASAYTFMCTHGGMGGTPWTPAKGQSPNDLIDEGGIDGMTTISFKQDAYVSAQIWSFCQKFGRAHGFV